MVDRIDKSTRVEDYWKVQSTANTHKEKGKDSSKDEFAGFQEKTDWNLLFDKSKLWKKNIQIQKSEIAQVRFQKVNLKTDPSLLRVDILLNGGERISPAFLAISRVDGLKIKNLHPGDPMDAGMILKNNLLTVTVPTNPDLFLGNEALAESKPAARPEEGELDENEDDDRTVKSAVKRLAPLAVRLHLMDPANWKLRPEIALVYGIGVLILLMIIWGYFLLR